MSMKKTQKQYFEEIINMLDSEEHKEFIKARIEALDKKSSSRKPTAEQIKAEEIGESILVFMEPSVLYTVTELWKKVPDFPEDSTFQYANAIVQKLYKGGKLDRVSEKGKTYFRLV